MPTPNPKLEEPTTTDHDDTLIADASTPPTRTPQPDEPRREPLHEAERAADGRRAPARPKAPSADASNTPNDPPAQDDDDRPHGTRDSTAPSDRPDMSREGANPSAADGDHRAPDGPARRRTSEGHRSSEGASTGDPSRPTGDEAPKSSDEQDPAARLERVRHRLKALSGEPRTDGPEGEAALFRNVAVDLTARAAAGRLPTIVGREREVRRVIESLCLTERSNVLLVGEEGSGRVGVIEALAQRLVANEVPAPLEGRQLWMVRASDLESSMIPARDRLSLPTAAAQAAKRGDLLFVAGGLPSPSGWDRRQTDRLREVLVQHPGTVIVSGASGAAREPSFERVASVVEVAPVGEELIAQAADEAVRARLGEDHPAADGAFVDAVVAAAKVAGRTADLPDLAVATLDLAATRAELDDAPLTQDVVDEAFADLCGPVESPTAKASRIAVLDGLRERLGERVIGQDHVIDEVVDQLSVAMLGHRIRSGRPLATMLFAGPTGVGKTELARALAEELAGDADAMVRLDMAEYGSDHDVWKIISPPPGIRGHGQASPLVAGLARNPRAVVLLDEIEKADPAVHRLFLRAFDEGVMTTADGERVSFSEATIVMTTNAMSQPARRGIGFDSGDEPQGADVVEALRGVFAPELVARMDAVCAFRRLGREDAERIVRESIVPRWLRAQPELEVQIDDEVWPVLARAGHDPNRGVRELERVVERLLLLPVSRLAAGGVSDLAVTVEDRELRFVAAAEAPERKSCGVAGAWRELAA